MPRLFCTKRLEHAPHPKGHNWVFILYVIYIENHKTLTLGPNGAITRVIYMLSTPIQPWCGVWARRQGRPDLRKVP